MTVCAEYTVVYPDPEEQSTLVLRVACRQTTIVSLPLQIQMETNK